MVAGIGALTDLVGIIVLGALVAAGRGEMEPWGWVIAGLSGGASVARMRGRHGGSTVAALVAAGPVVASVAKKGLLVAATVVKKVTMV